MPERQIQSSPVATLDLHGVNERVAPTYLPPEQFSQVNGVFPEFAGMQTRIFGKRVLAKYANPIYGIHQFFGPQGYGAGLYQFDGTVSTAPWITPVSKILLALLPLAVDGGNVTLDEFGQGWGGGGIVAPNVCVPNFNELNAAGISCAPQVSNFNAPIDDNNGSAAGKGKRCEWQTQVLATVPNSGFQLYDKIAPRTTCTASYNTVIIVPVAPTSPVPLGPIPTPNICTTSSAAIGVVGGVSITRGSDWGFTFGNFYTGQTGSGSSVTGIFDFTVYFGIYPTLLSITARIQIYAPFDTVPYTDVYLPLNVSRGDPNAVPPIPDQFTWAYDLTSYVPTASYLSANGRGFNAGGSASLISFEFATRVKVCTNN